MRRFLPLFVAAAILVAAAPARAQEALAYRTPSPEITDIVLAPPTPYLSLSPDQGTALILEVPSLPGIEELAERELRIAGLRISPQTNGRSRTRPFSGFRLLDIATMAERPVRGIAEGARLENVRWCPDGSRVAFTGTTRDGIELWVLDVATAEARRLTAPILNLAGGANPAWLGNEAVLCAVVPEDRGPEPPEPAVPVGPVVQENLGKTAPNRTYQDLLKNPYDEDLFDYYLTAQLAVVGLDGSMKRITEPAVLADFSPSPDGTAILVETWRRPYSYIVPAERFPTLVEILDRQGRRIEKIAELPLHEDVPVPFGSVPTGRREFSWRGDAGATLVWAEAQDDGDAGKEATIRDKVFVLPAPFHGKPVELATLDLRYDDVTWGNDETALVRSWWWKTRTQRVWRVQPGKAGAKPELVFDYSWEDRYHDPGTPETSLNAYGKPVLLLDPEGTGIYLIGDGASEEGDRPFLDRMNLATKETSRLFRSEAPVYERPVQVLDAKGRLVITRRESIEEPPNYFLRDLTAGTMKQLTRFPHPTPQLKGVHKELIRYTRKDGVPLTATLYTPAGYDRSQGPLPMVMWAYPQEFKSADAAGQVTDSPYRFVRVSWASPLVWLAHGYAVLDDPTMPIIGEGDTEPNDTYVEQLVASAEAAVDEVVNRGVAERGRIAIGGHSYGAFMTANLLAHSDLFAAGIARSGAYNRTLTPFGFQSEERTYWEAPEVYNTMSPFQHADMINEPILLIHGEADNNSGTFPIQSERFYAALKGHGATARLVMLPHEAHGYRAKESVLHMLWESEQWLDRYVRDARVPGETIKDPAESGPVRK